jgi:prepilin-type N-terminal cleavage/methylation domain-containing protein
MKKILLNKNKKVSLKNGFTLVEMLVYLAIMVVITLALVQSIIVVVKSNKQSFVVNNIKNSAISILEKMTREIRDASSIDVVNSVFGTSTGILQLNTTDSSGNAKTTQFYLQSNNLMVTSSSSLGVLTGPLNSNGAKVLSVNFTPISTAHSSAVKIVMTIEGTNQGLTKDVNFYSTAILRGSY